MKYTPLLAILLAGCAATPDHISACDDLFTDATEVQKCEKRVFAREDRAAREKAYYDKIASCTAQGKISYTGPSGRMVGRKDPKDVSCIDEQDLRTIL